MYEVMETVLYYYKGMSVKDVLDLPLRPLYELFSWGTQYRANLEAMFALGKLL